MQETAKIGDVVLNFKHYSGLDLYSDGAVEDEILDIVKHHKKEEYQKIIEQKANWPVLYHLSEQRGNIVEWIPMNHTEKVLEVGSGCGAITGTLAAKAKIVISCDLSKKRSEINATRNSDCSNVTIHVGNFRDIEPDLDKDFDYIFLIGVFEYGQGYIGTDTPYENFLMMLRKHLAPGGRIVIAIENKNGLKYFAGCAEDHLGKYFTGIEGYSKDSVAKTFSRNGLIKIFKKCGMNDYHFYYPYPDYKLMNMLHSDKYLPKFGELVDNVKAYDRDRMILFNEKHAYDDIIKDGYYPDFANSFEVILGPGVNTIYSKYSNDRADEFKIRTDIVTDKLGRKNIRKYPLTSKAQDHIRGMMDAYAGLNDKYRGADLEVNDCTLDEKDGCAVFSFVNGVPLSAMFDMCVDNDDMDSFDALFKEYLRRIGYNEKYPVSDFDLVFSNILVNGPIWTIIDYEWTYGKPIPAKELAFRALYCYVLEDRKREKINVKRLFKEIGLSDDEIKNLNEEEAAFQKYVTGNKKALSEIWKDLGHRVIVPEEIANDALKLRSADRVQIYMDNGEGYSEDESIFPEKQYDSQHAMTLDITVDEDTQAVRIDPAFSACIVTLGRVKWNGVSIDDGNIPIGMHQSGKWLSDDSILFDNDDPSFEFDLRSEGLNKDSENHLEVSYMMSMMPSVTAKALSKSLPEPTADQGKSGIMGKLSKIKNKIGRK